MLVNYDLCKAEQHTSLSGVGTFQLEIMLHCYKVRWDWQFVVVIDSYAVIMTKDIVVGDELPDWVGAKEFYQKYDPKEVIGRWVHHDSPHCNLSCLLVSHITHAVNWINGFSGGWAVWCAGVCTDTRVRSWRWRLLRSLRRRWPFSSWRRWKPPRWRRSKSSTWWRDTPQSVCWTSALLNTKALLFSAFGDSNVLKSCYVLFPSVTLIDSYESTTFIFLVFDLWVWRQIATMQWSLLFLP